MLLDTNFGYKAEAAYWKEEALRLQVECGKMADKLYEAEKDAKRYCEDSERLTHILTKGMPSRAGGKYWYQDGILFTTAIDCIDAAIATQEKP